MTINPPTLEVDPPLRSLPFTLSNLPRWPLLAAIRAYQLTLSRLVPRDTCRFWPTCSHYAYQAVYKYGVWKGGRMAVWRLVRCQPFAAGGYDPVP